MSDRSGSSSPDTEDTPPPIAQPFFPPAVVIRSGTARRVQVIDPDAPAQSSLYPPPPREVVWKEWAINPAKHGPEKLTRPPVFVQSKGNYDELGRSTLDGVDVDVEEGQEARRRDVDGGESVSAWYTALSRTASGNNTPREDAGPEVQVAEVVRVVRVSKEDAIDLTADSDEDEDNKPSVEVRDMSTLRGESSLAQLAPLRVNQNEWFIRRALLKSHIANLPSNPSISRPSSIGSMLGVTPIHHKPKTTQYVLGPENKGYEILKDRLGWAGGGLGRPAGWVDEAGPSRLGGVVDGDSTGAALGSLKEELERDIASSLAIKQEDAIVDLTGDSASEAGSEMDDELPTAGPSGPGRTLPIATSLKLDRLGLGHVRGKKDKQGNSLKRVTHTHQEIINAQRRGKFRKPVSQLELGHKGKIKWKEKDKKEREDRRRLAAALNG